jgi:hypothetical protein
MKADSQFDSNDPDRPLTPGEENFVAAFLKRPKYESAVSVAFSTNSMTPGRKRALGQAIAERPAVQRAIRLARLDAQVRAAAVVAQEKGVLLGSEAYSISKVRLAQHLAALAFSDLRDFTEWGPNGVTVKPSNELSAAQAYVITKVRQRTDKDGKVTIEFELADKQKALDALARLCGFVGPDADVGLNTVDDERRRRLKEFADYALPSVTKRVIAERKFSVVS